MSGGVIAQQTNINSDQYFFVLANGQQINVSTLIATNGYFSTIKGDTSFISSLISKNISTTSIIATNAFISSLISQNISTTSILATNAFISSLISQNISTTSILATNAYISSLQSANISTNNLSISTINNIGLSSFNLANWSEYKATNNIVGNSSKLQTAGLVDIYVPLIDISTINNATIANLQVKQYVNNTSILPTFYGGYINADNGISANSFSGNSASITAIGCVSLDAGNDTTNIGVISAYGVYRPPGFNALYVQGGTVLDGGGTIHGITIGTQPVMGVNTMRIDVLPVGIDITSATYVTIDAGAAGNFACGGALSLAGGSYIELNTANINCIDTTYPGSCVLNVDNIFPSQNGRGNLNSFDLYNCVAPNFFNASNIITNQLTSDNIDTSNINTSNILINTSNNTSNDYNSVYNTNSNFPSSFISSFTVNNSVSNLQVYNTQLISNVIGYDNTTLQNLGGSNYYVFIALGSSYFSNVFSNSIASIGGAAGLVYFGTSNGVGYADFYNQGSADPLYIEPNYPVSYTGFAFVPAGANQRVYFDPSFIPPGIRTVDIASIFPLYPSTFYSSIYSVDTFLTQNISSCSLTIDISGYDTNNLKYKSLGDFQINSSKFLTDKIYTNYISAGTISGGVPFSNNNLTVDSISTNRISTGVLQTNQIIFDNNGTAGLSTFNNFYRGYGGLLALSNVDFYLNKQDIVGVTTGDFERVSTISTISKIGLFSTLKTNYLNVSSISVNSLSVAFIENVSSITCGNISTNSLSVYQLENVSSITCGNISTNSLSVYKIESVSSLTAPIISSFNIVSRTGYFTGFVSTAVGYHDSITTGYINGSNGTLNYNSESIFPNRATANIGYQIANNNSGCWNNFNGLNANLSSINATSGNPLSTIGINGYLKGDNFVAKLLSSVTISTATITGLGAYFSSISAGSIIGGISQTNINSTIDGLGTVGYISSSQLTSTVTGLGQIYVSSIQGSIQSDITSSITGLGTVGYISSSQLTSTVRGLGLIYLSSIQGSIQSDITSSITGLGTIGYVSSSQLTSTVRGLGTAGYVSTPSLVSTIVGWAGIPANKNVNLYGNDILNINNVFTDVISPSHSDFVLFDGNGIQTNNITSADFTQINFNNDINLEQHYSLKDALSLQINDGANTIIMCNDAGDGGIARFYTTQNSFFFTTSNGNSAVIQLDYNDVCDTYFSNDTSGYFHLSNTNNTLIFEGLVEIDNIRGYINPNVSFQQPILVDSISPYSGDYVSFPGNGISTDFITAYSNPYIGFNNDANLLANNIIDVNQISVDYITANSNTIIGITSPLDLNYRNINNVSNISLDFLSNNSNRAIEVFSDFIIDGTLSVVNITNGLGYLDFSDNNLRNIPRIDFNYAGNNGGIGITSNPFRTGSLLYISNADFTFANQNVYNAGSYTGTNISTINISTSVITSQEIYTKNLGNNNPYAVQSIIVNNDFNMGQNNISNANTLTTSNISTINISTACLFTSSLTVSTINNSIFPLIQYGSGTNNNTITLPKHYANTNYQILLTQRGSSAIIPLYSSNITTSNFYVGGSAGSYQFSWMTTGY